MAKASALREMSVEQLEKALLSKLVAAREQMRKDLGSLDLKIRDLSGGPPFPRLQNPNLRMKTDRVVAVAPKAPRTARAVAVLA